MHHWLVNLPPNGSADELPATRRAAKEGQGRIHILSGQNIRDNSQVMSVVDKYEPQGLVSVKNTKGEVSKPGLGIKVMHLSQDPLGLIEQRPKLRWRDVLPRQHGIWRLPAASRNPAAGENKCRHQGESRTGCRRRGSDERLTDSNHRQAAVMKVHTDRPFGHGRSAQSRTRHGTPKIL